MSKLAHDQMLYTMEQLEIRKGKRLAEIERGRKAAIACRAVAKLNGIDVKNKKRRSFGR